MKRRIALAAAAALFICSNAWAESSQMFATRFVGDGQFLYRVDTGNGSATLVGKIGIGKGGFISVPAVAVDFDSSGKLYGGSQSTLSVIGTKTGRALPITSTFIDDVRGLAFSPDDRLFVFGQSFGRPALYEVDRHSGAVLRKVFLPPDLEGIVFDGIDFAPDGTLYALTFDSLVTIDIDPEDPMGTILSSETPLELPSSNDPFSFLFVSGLDISPDYTFRTNLQEQGSGRKGSVLATIDLDPESEVVKVTEVGPTGDAPPAVFLFGLAHKP